MSSQLSKTTPSEGFTCDCEHASSSNTNMHKTSCWKVPKCIYCKERSDSWYLCSCEDIHVSQYLFECASKN